VLDENAIPSNVCEFERFARFWTAKSCESFRAGWSTKAIRLGKLLWTNLRDRAIRLHQKRTWRGNLADPRQASPNPHYSWEFYCNRKHAAATSLAAVQMRPGSPLGRSTSCSRMPPSLAAPRARLARRLRGFATNPHAG